MQQKNTAFRKRDQIQKANRTMFIWVAGISALFGAVLVIMIFLSQMLVYNEKVLKQKNITVSTLKQNYDNVAEVEAQVRLIDTNQALAKLKARSEDKAIQVILDALPSEANSPALGSSLQNKLLSGIPGLSSDISMSVDPVIGVENLIGGSSVVSAADTGVVNNKISFRFTVSGDNNALRAVLQNLERSIRTIKVLSVRIESQGGSQRMVVQGEAYYENEKIVELKDMVVEK